MVVYSTICSYAITSVTLCEVHGQIVTLICASRNVFFLNRIIGHWTELPQNVKKAKALDVLKAELGKEKLFKILKNIL